MTKLIFRYTVIYDLMLARMAGQRFTVRHEREGRAFRRRVERHWHRYNDRCFRLYRSLGLVLPDWWLAYHVHPWRRLIPFSDPLTLLIRRDLDSVVATIVHELRHTFFTYYENDRVFARPWRHIQRTFTHESMTTRLHLVVNQLARAGLRYLMRERKAERLLAPERKYEGLARAWAIIDAQRFALPTNPLEAILALRRIGNLS